MQYSTQAESQCLGGDGDEDLKGPSVSLSVEASLRCNDIEGIRKTTSKGCVGHNSDEGMFFLGEGPWVELALSAEKGEGKVGESTSPGQAERKGDDFGDVRRNRDGRAVQRE